MQFSGTWTVMADSQRAVPIGRRVLFGPAQFPGPRGPRVPWLIASNFPYIAAEEHEDQAGHRTVHQSLGHNVEFDFLMFRIEEWLIEPKADMRMSAQPRQRVGGRGMLSAPLAKRHCRRPGERFLSSGLC